MADVKVLFQITLADLPRLAPVATNRAAAQAARYLRPYSRKSPCRSLMASIFMLRNDTYSLSLPGPRIIRRVAGRRADSLGEIAKLNETIFAAKSNMKAVW